MNIISKRKQRHKKTTNRIKEHNDAVQITIGSISIIIIGIILSITIPQAGTAIKNVKQYRILEKMVEIDDVAHQQDAMLHKINSGYNMKRDRMFHVADNTYHKSQFRDEKFRAAMELNVLIKEQNEFLHKIVGSGNPFSDAAKERFDGLQKQLELLQQ